MAQVTDYDVANAAGNVVRQDINDILAAIKTLNSGTQANLGTTSPYQLFADSTNQKLKIRSGSGDNAAASATFFEIGDLESPNLGLLPKSGGAMSGVLELDDANSASTPALCFDGDEDTGLFRKAANVMGFSSGGAEQMVFDANGITLRQQNEIRFGDNDSSHYVAIMSSHAVGTSFTLKLPTAQGANGTYIHNDGSGNLSFQPATVIIGSTTINVGGNAASAISGLTTLGLTTLNATEVKSNNYRDQNGNNSFTASQVASLIGGGTTGGGVARAFVNFQGTGTVSVRAGHNVSSITDNGTGDYTVNFTTNLADANYTPVSMTLSHDTQGNQITTVVRGSSTGGPSTMTTSACRITRGGTTGNHFTDGQSIYFAAFR